jgi:hypothetical protein
LLSVGRARIEGRYGTNVPDSLGVAVPIPRYSALAAIANPRFGMIASTRATELLSLAKIPSVSRNIGSSPAAEHS